MFHPVFQAHELVLPYFSLGFPHMFQPLHDFTAGEGREDPRGWHLAGRAPPERPEDEARSWVAER